MYKVARSIHATPEHSASVRNHEKGKTLGIALGLAIERLGLTAAKARSLFAPLFVEKEALAASVATEFVSKRSDPELFGASSAASSGNASTREAFGNPGRHRE